MVLFYFISLVCLRTKFPDKQAVSYKDLNITIGRVLIGADIKEKKEVDEEPEFNHIFQEKENSVHTEDSSLNPSSPEQS